MVRKRPVVPKKISRRKARIVKPMKIAALIVSAIQDLRETKGSTPKKIVGYISYASDVGEGRVKRQVKAALQRGVEYGILRRYRGQYFLPMGDELDRANRIALRFAKLPLPPTHMKSNTDSPRKMVPLGGQRNSRKFNKNSPRMKRLGKAKSPLLSSTFSLTDTLRNIDEN
ncbi:uncharacterized protein LOC143208943 [Lasioglossum baleicum]|uniref:uncharacterized protein LOC143208943 n=1 Tax=Lasioglossum baleicum TaxID=434251 RepID=UPI003FCD132D